MTKKKNTASRMLLALVALTLVSFCFLGSTFARYTSTGTGTAITQVAEWSITGDWEQEEGEADAIFGTLSPSMAEWQDGETRSHSTSLALVATITNESEVGALVTLSADEVATLSDDTAEVESVDGDHDFDINHARARFTIELYWTYESDGTGCIPYTSEIALQPVGGEQAIAYIYAVVTWTSLDSEGEAFADALDTWIGENITEVSWNLSYTAVQNTQLP